MKPSTLILVIAAIVIAALVLVGRRPVKTIANPGDNMTTQGSSPSPTAKPTDTLNTTTTHTPTPAPTSASSAVIKTKKGDIAIELFPSVAPKSVENFSTLAKSGYFNNLAFHRVESWVIQAGDPTGTGAGGGSIYGGTYTDDFKADSDIAKTGYKRGIVAMAKKASDPKFAGSSQFFIIKTDTPLPLEYAIFGRVTSGMDVVDQIAVGDKMTEVDLK